MLGIRVEGVRELTRAIARLEPEVAKEIGQKNKAIGARIIARAFPKPESSGAGAGATPRPSASRNVLQIMAGGAHRTHVPVQQWGVRQVSRGEKRAYIWQAAAEEIAEAERNYLDGLFAAARRVGLTGGFQN